MYISTQMLRLTFQERLRDAETRRLVNEATVGARDAQGPRRRRRGRLGLLRGLGLRSPVSPA
jgi:hypothetical protein